MRIGYIFVLVFIFSAFRLSAQASYFPPADATGVWETTSPAEMNWCQDSIDALYDFLESEQTKSFILLKDGKIILENYFGTYQQDSLFPWFSAGKSLRAVLVGIAESEDDLSIDQPASTYLGSGWTSLTEEQEDSITVRNLLTMTSGLNENFFYCRQPSCRIYSAPAGQRWAYHNSPYAITEELLEVATGESLNAYITTRIRQKIGMAFGLWLNYAIGRKTYFSKARDMARFGLLVQRNGRWEDEVVYPENDYFTEMLLPSQPMNPSYGYLWWLNGQEGYIGPDSPVSFPGMFSPSAPADLLLAAGANGQFISISRETGLIMIRQGSSDDESLAPRLLHDEIWKKINHLDCGPTPVTEIEMNKAALNAYPNPARNWLRVNNLAPGDVALLYDYSGRIIRQLTGRMLNYVGDLPRGQYIIITSGNSKHTMKLVLN